MPPAGLSDLPVELSERILECLDVLDILQLKLAASRSRTESLIVHLVTQINLSISRHLSFRPYRVLSCRAQGWQPLQPGKSSTVLPHISVRLERSDLLEVEDSNDPRS